jgi:hypothetical protein
MEDVEMQLDSIRNYNFKLKTDDKTKYSNVGDTSINNSIIEREVIYNKLNEKSDTNIDVSTNNDYDLKSVKSINSEKLTALASTRRDLLNKVIIKVDYPYDEYNSETFAYVICKNIKTLKVDDKCFTYLNNPKNDVNSFFININEKTNQYELIDQIVYETEIIKYLQIPYQILSEFTKGLNNILKNVGSDYTTLKKRFVLKKALKIVLMYILMIVLCLGSFLQIDNIFALGNAVGYSVFISIGIYILCVLYFSYVISTCRYIKYARYKVFLSHQQEVEDYIDRYVNNELKKYRKQVIIPMAYQYIQFCYNCSLKFFVENHEIIEYV